MRQQETLIICSSIKSRYPQINLSLIIEADFAVHGFYRDMEMRTIGGYKISKHVTCQNTLEILIENMEKINTEQHQTKPQNIILILKLVTSFLLLIQEETNKHSNSIKFIYEQLNLMTQNKLLYSTEMMIFSSLLYTCTPKGYRLLRDSKNTILSSYSTITRLTLSTYMNPLIT